MAFFRRRIREALAFAHEATLAELALVAMQADEEDMVGAGQQDEPLALQPGAEGGAEDNNDNVDDEDRSRLCFGRHNTRADTSGSLARNHAEDDLDELLEDVRDHPEWPGRANGQGAPGMMLPAGLDELVGGMDALEPEEDAGTEVLGELDAAAETMGNVQGEMAAVGTIDLDRAGNVEVISE